MQKRSESDSFTSNKTALIVHILGILTFFLASLLAKNLAKSTNTKLHAKKALNWQINVILFLIVGIILKVVFVGYLIIPAALILNIAFSIIAAIKASKNELWDYPLSFTFLE